MSDFLDPGVALPRADASTWQRLLPLYGRPLEELAKLPVELRSARFHSHAERHVTESELVRWRDSLNSWAYDRGFPAGRSLEHRSRWDVELGQRLIADAGHLPELLHPGVWSWIATNLLPHFVVHRWGWPSLTEGAPPGTRNKWSRFGNDGMNGLRIAIYRIATYGPEITARAIEQEFQSIQYRPAYGVDQRVARIVLSTLLEAYDDPNSRYAKEIDAYEGDERLFEFVNQDEVLLYSDKASVTRSLDANFVCIELRVVNALRPLCFMTDEDLADEVRDVISRLPELRYQYRRGRYFQLNQGETT